MPLPTVTFGVTPPALGDDELTFNTRMDATLNRLPGYTDELNELGGAMGDALNAAVGAATATTTGTSATSIVIGTGNRGPFVTQAGKNWVVGSWVTIASAANPTVDFMNGIVSAYAGTSLTITVPAGFSSGAGARTDWVIGLSGKQGPAVPLDPDVAMAANSDLVAATQKATKAYVDNAVTGLWDLKGVANCAANPNYPAASKGDAYMVSVAGRIGGVAGIAVEGGDVFVAMLDNAGGTHAAAGASWMIIQANLVQALLSSGGTMSGLLTTMAAAAGGAGFNMPHGAAPAAPANGDVWTTSAGVYARINGVTVGPFIAGVNWTQIATVATTSGAAWTFNNLPVTYSRLLIDIQNFKSSATDAFWVQVAGVSASFSQPFPFWTALTAGSAFDAFAEFVRPAGDRGFFNAGCVVGGVITTEVTGPLFVSPLGSVDRTTSYWVAPGGIRHLRFSTSTGGSGTSGSITLWGI